MATPSTSTEQSLEDYQKKMNDLANDMKTMTEDELATFLHQQADPWNKLADSYKAERDNFHQDIRSQAVQLYGQVSVARKNIVTRMKKPRNGRDFIALAWAVDGYRQSVALMGKLLEEAPTYQPEEAYQTDDAEPEYNASAADSADHPSDDTHSMPSLAVSATPAQKRNPSDMSVVGTATKLSKYEPQALRKLRKRHNSPDRRPERAHV